MVSRAAAVVAAILLVGHVSPRLLARSCQFSLFSDQPAIFLKAIHQFDSGQIPPIRAPVRGGIVTHHFLASRLMVEYFETVRREMSPLRVILIGPDHLGRCPEGLAITPLEWITPFGRLPSDKETVQRLRKRLGLRHNDQECFFKEHSIGALIPFVRYYFPHSKIIPMLISGRVSRQRLMRLTELLKEMDDGNTHILLSMDFSHGKNIPEARRLDGMTASVIRQGDYDRVWDLDVDCRSGLYLMLRLFGHGAATVGSHTSSSEISGVDSENITSYFTLYFH